MTPTDRYVTIDGLRTRLRESGPADARTIAYFHIYSGLSEETDEFAGLVADRYRFVAVDARGHGHTEWGPPDGYTPDRYLADALAALDAIGGAPVVVMGSSFGAATALRIAAHHAQRVSALIIDDQPPEFPSAESKDALEKSAERQRELRFADLDEVVAWAQKLRRRHFNWQITDQQARRWAEAATQPAGDGPAEGSALRFRNDPDSMACMAQFCGTPQANLRDDFASIGVPTLVARRDGAGAALDGPIWDELHALNPRARYETFEGAGHPVVFTRPRELAAVVRDFLG
jgi:pimeloyl-ACP methyl ester carboxylesterase